MTWRLLTRWVRIGAVQETVLRHRIELESLGEDAAGVVIALTRLLAWTPRDIVSILSIAIDAGCGMGAAVRVAAEQDGPTGKSPSTPCR